MNLTKEEVAKVQIWLQEAKDRENNYDILGDIEPCDITGW